MIALSPRASQQVRRLLLYFGERSRPEAQTSLVAALDAAIQSITAHPDAGLAAPRPYPGLARPGRAWIKSGRYWIAYQPTTPPVIIGVFHDTADIPSRA